MSKGDQRKREYNPEARELLEKANRKVEEQIWDNCPIKQFVRRYIWLDVIKGYLERREQIGVQRPWNYLTLPGANASDIGVLYSENLFVPDEDGRLPVAVCDIDNGDIVYNNLQSLGGILAYSKDHLHIALQDTVRRDALYRFFPFDVINLDLCESLLPLTSNIGIETLRTIFNYQRGQSFLMLLTTKPDTSALERYKEVIVSNLEGEPAFKAAYEATFGSDSVELCMEDYTVFTQLVIPKLVARMAKIYGYRVNERSAARYERPFPKQREGKATGYDMVCHSIEFEAIHFGNSSEVAKYKPRRSAPQMPKTDPIVLSSLPSRVEAKALESYPAFVSQLPGRTVQNVVEHLRQDPDLERRLAEEAISLKQWWRHGQPGVELT